MKYRQKLLLIGPVAIALVITVVLSRYPIWDGFFSNLTSELVGILITILYIDWILDRHDRRTWKDTDRLVARRIRTYLNGSITYLRGSLGYGLDTMNESVREHGDIHAVEVELIRATREVIEPTLNKHVTALDAKGWILLVKNLQGVCHGSDEILTLFGGRLSAVQMECLLQIKTLAEATIQLYSVWPDILGIPDALLPASSGTPSATIKRESNQDAVSYLQQLFAQLRELAETVPTDNLILPAITSARH